MFLPFTPLVSFTKLPSSLFPGQHSEKNSRAHQEVQVVKNVPNEKGTPIEISACVNETEDAVTRVNRAIDTLRTAQNNAQAFKNSLISLKEKIDSVTNQPDKGFLRYSETKDLYLSNHFKILETVGLRDAGAAKFEKKFDGLELEFGKKTSKENIISKIDEKLADQDKYINTLGDRIKLQEGKLSAERPTTNDADSNTPDEIKSDQHEDMNDVLSPWPKEKPQNQFVHSLISNHLKCDKAELTDDQIEYLESILNDRKNPEKQDSQSNFDTTGNPTAQIISQQSIESIDQISTEKKDNKSGAFRPPVPPRTSPYKERTSAPDKNIQANPAQPVLAKATERAFEKLFNSEQKTPDDRGVLPSSQVKRSESEAGTRSAPIRPPRKIDLLKTLNRTQSDPASSTTGTTENTFNDIRAYWEVQSKSGSV
ncbi:hypothetical protein SAMN05216598_1434 [Pseudomonas asplenii]|uniref:Uncharacterized protein n=1 Tax=Pseudomonas asplenii TaxID=53407 RepID=A0A1H1RTA7_9PSED|nr:hypothetical protein [Pseudomonas asplenii]SDS38914.1 hypothetical protein SAMN05216598_1434 [Pseudomonas asplenii]